MKVLLILLISGICSFGYCVEEELSLEDIEFIDSLDDGLVEDTQLDLVETEVKDKSESFTEIGE